MLTSFSWRLRHNSHLILFYFCCFVYLFYLGWELGWKKEAATLRDKGEGEMPDDYPPPPHHHTTPHSLPLLKLGKVLVVGRLRGGGRRGDAVPDKHSRGQEEEGREKTETHAHTKQRVGRQMHVIFFAHSTKRNACVVGDSCVRETPHDRGEGVTRIYFAAFPPSLSLSFFVMPHRRRENNSAYLSFSPPPLRVFCSLLFPLPPKLGLNSVGPPVSVCTSFTLLRSAALVSAAFERRSIYMYISAYLIIYPYKRGDKGSLAGGTRGRN